MNWRWIVPVALLLAVVDVLLGFAAYGSKTWNSDHTKVLTGWAAVREVCLVFFPIFAAVILVGAALIIAGIEWAKRGER